MKQHAKRKKTQHQLGLFLEATLLAGLTARFVPQILRKHIHCESPEHVYLVA